MVVRLIALLVCATLLSASPSTAHALHQEDLMSPDDDAIALINDERVRAGIEPLQVKAALTAAALSHAQDMADTDYFAHASADGRTPQERAAEHGYTSYRAENIARGQHSPDAVVDSWMNSEGHRRNLLNPDLDEIGLGVAERVEGGPVWVAKFGKQDSA